MRLLVAVLIVLSGCQPDPLGRSETSVIGVREIFVSSDGEKIGFSYRGRVWMAPLKGGVAWPVSPGDGFERRAVLSSDGRFLLFQRENEQGVQYVVTDLTTYKETVLSPGRRWDRDDYDMPDKAQELLKVYRFARGDRRIIASSIGRSGTPPEAVSVDLFNRSKMSVVPSELTTAVSNDGLFALAARNGLNPALLSNYQVPRNTIDIARLTRGRLVLKDLRDGSEREIFSSDDRAVGNPQVSADGRYAYVILRGGGIEEITAFDLFDNTFRTLYSGVLADREFVLLPDDTSMLLLENGRLFRVNLESFTKRPIRLSVEETDNDRPNVAVMFTGATVFVGNSNTSIPGLDVLVVNGRIEGVGSNLSSLPFANSAEVVDANGLFLMAGLVDAHAHVSMQSVFRLPDILQSGITSVIDPGASYVRKTERLEAIQEAIVDGPHIYSFSDLIMGVGSTVTVSSYAAFVVDTNVARQLTRRYKSLGYVGMKLYSTVGPKVAKTVIEQAHREGLLVIGHLGSTTWTEAVEAQIDSLTHMMPFLCAEAFESAGNRFRSFSQPDRQCLSELFDLMAIQGTTFDPNIVKHSPFLTSSPKYETVKSQYPDYPYEAEYVTHADILLDAISRGVNVVIGRDEWDHSLVFEMEAYEAIGVPRSLILQMATRNSAEFLGQANEFGTIEVGKRADLIVVDGNPLKDIGSLRSIVIVMKDGKIVANRLGR